MLAQQDAERRASKHAKTGTSTSSIARLPEPMSPATGAKSLKNKDRKKNKNKGLASLLAKQKATAATTKTGSALDLSDFMM